MSNAFTFKALTSKHHIWQYFMMDSDKVAKKVLSRFQNLKNAPLYLAGVSITIHTVPP